MSQNLKTLVTGPAPIPWNIFRWETSADSKIYSHGKNCGIIEMYGNVEPHILITQTEQSLYLFGDIQGAHICQINPMPSAEGRKIAEEHARLISAAPKMLYALLKALPYMHDLEKENIQDESVGIFMDYELQQAYMALLSAIAYATNKTPEEFLNINAATE